MIPLIILAAHTDRSEPRMRGDDPDHGGVAFKTAK